MVQLSLLPDEPVAVVVPAAEPRVADVREVATTLVRRGDPGTSLEAALRHVASGKFAQNKAIVLWALCRQPCSTYAELAKFINQHRPANDQMQESEPARRLQNLVDEGLAIVLMTKERDKKGELIPFQRECSVHGTKMRVWFPTGSAFAKLGMQDD